MYYYYFFFFGFLRNKNSFLEKFPKVFYNKMAFYPQYCDEIFEREKHNTYNIVCRRGNSNKEFKINILRKKQFVDRFYRSIF